MSDIQEWDCSIEAHKVFKNFVTATTLLYASKRLISESPKPKFSLSEYDPKKVLKVEYYNLIFSKGAENTLYFVMDICKSQFDIVKSAGHWKVPIDDLIESLHKENSFFLENKDIYMKEVIKHFPRPLLAKKSKIFTQQPAEMFKAPLKNEMQLES